MTISLISIARQYFAPLNLQSDVTCYAANHLNDLEQNWGCLGRAIATLYGYLYQSTLAPKAKEIRRVDLAIYRELNYFVAENEPIPARFEVRCEMNGEDQTLFLCRIEGKYYIYLEGMEDRKVLLANITSFSDLFSRLKHQFDDFPPDWLDQDGELRPELDTMSFNVYPELAIA